MKVCKPDRSAKLGPVMCVCAAVNERGLENPRRAAERAYTAQTQQRRFWGRYSEVRPWVVLPSCGTAKKGYVH